MGSFFSVAEIITFILINLNYKSKIGSFSAKMVTTPQL